MEEKDPRRRRRQADTSLLRVCNFKMEGSESSLGILLTPLSPDVLIGGWPFDQGCIQQRPLIFFPALLLSPSRGCQNKLLFACGRRHRLFLSSSVYVALTS